MWRESWGEKIVNYRKKKSRLGLNSRRGFNKWKIMIFSFIIKLTAALKQHLQNMGAKVLRTQNLLQIVNHSSCLIKEDKQVKKKDFNSLGSLALN